MKTMFKFFKIVLLILIFVQCGGSQSTPVTGNNSQNILIVDNRFVPDSITVSAGDTIFFFNEDAIVHQILSQSAADQFDATDLFNTLLIDPGSEAAIQIPEDTASGTTLFFYDDILRGQMSTPNGSIIVE